MIHGELEATDNDYPLFHGSWDWHSCVHGHWAALWLSKHLGEKEIHGAIQERLQRAAFHDELRYLQQNPSFERPYGLAWLLRLGVTWERQGGEAPLYFAANSIRSWLMEAVNMTAEREYQNSVWVLLQLWAWYEHRQNDDGLHFCRQQAHLFLNGYTPTLSADFQPAPAFFSPWSLWVLLARKAGHDSAMKRLLQPKDFLHVVENLPTVHHLGLNPARAWGLWVAYQQTQDTSWLQAYRDHLLFSEQLTVRYKENRYAYTHWVPQFIVYALWLENQPP